MRKIIYSIAVTAICVGMLTGCGPEKDTNQEANAVKEVTIQTTSPEELHQQENAQFLVAELERAKMVYDDYYDVVDKNGKEKHKEAFLNYESELSAINDNIFAEPCTDERYDEIKGDIENLRVQIEETGSKALKNVSKDNQEKIKNKYEIKTLKEKCKNIKKKYEEYLEKVNKKGNESQKAAFKGFSSVLDGYSDQLDSDEELTLDSRMGISDGLDTLKDSMESIFEAL
ncbi:MAG: hypothetical protein K6G11_06520 [Lachnospiraceae bacterium]|nr:hypothetical protein [Lachnospiraceae bacterium]